MRKTMLVKNADVVVTMDAARREIRNGGLFVADQRIVAVGPQGKVSIPSGAKVICRRPPTFSATSRAHIPPGT